MRILPSDRILLCPHVFSRPPGRSLFRAVYSMMRYVVRFSSHTPLHFKLVGESSRSDGTPFDYSGFRMMHALLCRLSGVIGGANLVGFGITASTKTHKLTDLTGAGAFVLSAAACAW